MKNTPENLITLNRQPLPKTGIRTTNQSKWDGIDRRDPTRPLYKISPDRSVTLAEAVETIMKEKKTQTLVRQSDTINTTSRLLLAATDKLKMCLPEADLSEKEYPELSLGRSLLKEKQRELATPGNEEERAKIQRLSAIDDIDTNIQTIYDGLRKPDPIKIAEGFFSKIGKLFTKNS